MGWAWAGGGCRGAGSFTEGGCWVKGDLALGRDWVKCCLRLGFMSPYNPLLLPPSTSFLFTPVPAFQQKGFQGGRAVTYLCETEKNTKLVAAIRHLPLNTGWR